MAYQWDVFISHSSEDKESFVRPLAEGLKAEGLEVWYDEFTLTVGDSLRRSIEHGLSKSGYGVVVLSHAFFSKEWPQQELDGLASRETDGTKVILPVWLNVSAEDVTNYSPMLAGRLALRAEQGMEHVVKQLLAVVRGERKRLSPAGVQTSDGNGLGQEERDILLAAATAGDGLVLSIGHQDGHEIQVGDRNFTENANQRTIEKYKAAVRKLVERRYLEPQGYKGEVFKVTNEGYEAADRIQGNVAAGPVEPPHWGKSLERYRRDFPQVESFISIENVFGREFSGDWDDFREAVRRSRVPLIRSETFPWTDPPPEGKRAEWRRRRGVLLPFWSWKYCDILESGHFLFCSNMLMWEEDDETSVGVQTTFYHLLVDLTYAGRLAAALGISGPGGRVELALHGVKGRRLHGQADFQSVFPECTDDNPTAPLDYAFSTNPDSIREAAIDVVYELLTFFPQDHDGSRLISRNQLEEIARDIQQKNGLLG